MREDGLDIDLLETWIEELVIEEEGLFVEYINIEEFSNIELMVIVEGHHNENVDSQNVEWTKDYEFWVYDRIGVGLVISDELFMAEYIEKSIGEIKYSADSIDGMSYDDWNVYIDLTSVKEELSEIYAVFFNVLSQADPTKINQFEKLALEEFSVLIKIEKQMTQKKKLIDKRKEELASLEIKKSKLQETIHDKLKDNFHKIIGKSKDKQPEDVLPI
jgi:hypothetical protein